MKKRVNTDYLMGTMDYKKAFWKLAIPTISTFLVMTMYMTIDRLLIARLVGPEALGAMQYAFPIFYFISPLTMIIGVGTKIHFSKLQGEKRTDKINELISNAFWLMLATGVILTSILLVLGQKAPGWMGARGPINQYAMEYVKIMTYGILAQSIVLLAENLFQSKGYVRSIMIFTLFSQLTNLTLDIYFMKYLKMGIGGSAWATVVSIVLSLILYIITILFFKKEFLINIFKNKFSWIKTKKILTSGSPAAIDTWILSIKMIVFTYFLTKIATDQEIITYSAARTITMLVMMPSFGMAAAISPMLSYNHGAKNPKRFMNIARYGLKTTTVYLLTAALILWFFPTQLLKIFSSTTFSNAKYIVRSIVFGFWMLGYPVIWGTIFRSSGLPKENTIIIVTRNVIVFLPTVYIMAQFNSVDLFWLAFPISDILGVVFTLFYVRWVLAKPQNTGLKSMI